MPTGSLGIWIWPWHNSLLRLTLAFCQSVLCPARSRDYAVTVAKCPAGSLGILLGHWINLWMSQTFLLYLLILCPTGSRNYAVSVDKRPAGFLEFCSDTRFFSCWAFNIFFLCQLVLYPVGPRGGSALSTNVKFDWHLFWKEMFPTLTISTKVNLDLNNSTISCSTHGIFV